MSLLLRELESSDEDAFLQGFGDWQGHDPNWYSFIWRPGMSYLEHLELLEKAKDESQIPSHFVPSTMLYAFLDSQIVGRLSIRHKLNESLLVRGGHLGYAVSPKHRQKGFAREIYRQGLYFCKDLGLSKIMITCAEENIGSWKVIEAFNFSPPEIVFDKEKNENFRRYWVDLN